MVHASTWVSFSSLFKEEIVFFVVVVCFCLFCFSLEGRKENLRAISLSGFCSLPFIPWRQENRHGDTPAFLLFLELVEHLDKR